MGFLGTYRYHVPYLLQRRLHSILNPIREWLRGLKNNIESKYPNLHIDLHRDQFKSGDVDELEKLYCQLEEVKKYGDVNQGLGSWNGYEYVPNNN